MLGAWHCPNLPGHGSNPQLDCSPEATIQHIESVRTQTRRQLGQPANLLLGYSAGARAALSHALAYPDAWKALILISVNPGIEEIRLRLDRQKSDRELADRILEDGVEEFLEYWQKTPIIQSQKAIASSWKMAMRRNRLRHSREGLSQSLLQFGQGSFPNLWPKICEIRVPVLIVTGGNDRKYTDIGKRIHDVLCAASGSKASHSHTIIPNGGHMPHLECPEATARTIDTFLAENDLDL